MPNPAEPRFPTHVAIIVDGNRRWAKQRLLPVSMGHKAGFDRLREITRYAVGDRGVFVLSLYVFSTENFSRDAKEVGYLMDLFANNFRTIADEMNERGCKVLFSGRRESLQEDAELILMRIGTDDEGEYMDIVDDDEELITVGKVFEERLRAMYDIDDSELQ